MNSIDIVKHSFDYFYISACGLNIQINSYPK
jgi:hypothetical protein